jgi:hypothetical protein
VRDQQRRHERDQHHQAQQGDRHHQQGGERRRQRGRNHRTSRRPDDSRGGGDRSDDRRYGSRYGGPDTGSAGGARQASSEQHGRDTGGRTPDRDPGERPANVSNPHQGNPRTGSQRGEESVQGVSGRVGKQYGDLHGPRVSKSESEGYHADHQFGGDMGRSSRDRRYGSRRGHGSQRRENPETDP